MRLHSNPLLTLDESNFSFSQKYSSLLKSNLKKGIPFVYLIGEAEFYSRLFFISPDVLIPRQETEFLVDYLVNQKRIFNKALDVGTGSGVIILSLLLSGLVREGVGSDISNEALLVAQANNFRLRAGCRFVTSDRLYDISETFDLIVSNPPYIKENLHRGLVHAKVDQFEPYSSLYLKDEDYSFWFEIFFTQVKKQLNPGGLFIMEGHEMELQSQSHQLRSLGFDQVQVIQDLAGVDRFVMGIIS